VFFSSPISRDLLPLIKKDTSLLSRISALREVLLVLQGFSTDNERALEQLFAEQSDKTQDYKVCIDTMACRLATVFASMKENCT
jgi:syntaxin-binding protein 1